MTARSGQRSTAVLTLARPGPSRPNPAVHSIAAGIAVLPACGPAMFAVTRDSVTAPPRQSTAATSRTQLNQRRRTAASASASVGRVRAAPRAAMNAAPSAVSRAVPAPTAIGTQPARNTIDSGTTPAPANTSSSQPPSSGPGQQASAVAAAATTSVSPRTSRCNWAGVVPIARSSAISRCRCWRARPSVLATTNTVTPADSPPNTAAIVIRVPLPVTTAVFSARPRSSPVSTVAGAPATAASTACRTEAGSLPGVVNTPMESTWPGRLTRVAASASARNTAPAAPGPATRPVTRYWPVRPDTDRVTRPPTRTPAASARPGSSAAWPARAGSAPSVSESGARRVADQLRPVVGGSTGAPSRNTAEGNARSGTAAATPGTDATRSTRPASSRTRSANSSPSSG